MERESKFAFQGIKLQSPQFEEFVIYPPQSTKPKSSLIHLVKTIRSLG